MLTTSELKLSLALNGQSVPNKVIHWVSDRGSTIDQFGPSDTVTTDATGKASTSVSTRIQPGPSTISPTDSGIKIVQAGNVKWLPARYEQKFQATCYTIADENRWLKSPSVKNVCGLPKDNLYHSAFLTDTAMQGTGKTVDGQYIKYDRGAKCYYEDSCPRTKVGKCAVVGQTIAADFNVIPKNGTVNVDVIGQRVAQDVGGDIKGYHIDEFVGPQYELCRQIGKDRYLGIEFSNY